MLIHRTPVGQIIHTPAKVNLFFEITGQRDDGFHEVETLMFPLVFMTPCVSIQIWMGKSACGVVWFPGSQKRKDDQRTPKLARHLVS